MQVQTPGRFENAPQFDKARGHHRQVREHVAVAEEGAKRLHGLGHAAALLDYFLIGACRVLVPRPGILERLDLRCRLSAVFGEQDVIGGVRIEWRVEVDEIDALIGDVASQDIEVVAVVEPVRRVLSHAAEG